MVHQVLQEEHGQNVPSTIRETLFCLHPCPAGQLGCALSCYFNQLRERKQGPSCNARWAVMSAQVLQVAIIHCSKIYRFSSLCIPLFSCQILQSPPLLIRLLLWNPQEVIGIIKLCWSYYICELIEFLYTQNYNQKTRLKINSSSRGSLYESLKYLITVNWGYWQTHIPCSSLFTRTEIFILSGLVPELLQHLKAIVIYKFHE